MANSPKDAGSMSLQNVRIQPKYYSAITHNTTICDTYLTSAGHKTQIKEEFGAGSILHTSKFSFPDFSLGRFFKTQNTGFTAYMQQ